MNNFHSLCTLNTPLISINSCFEAEILKNFLEIVKKKFQIDCM